MELTVYRQASKQRPSGTIVYKGEDAYPYVDAQLLLVADGMGGSAAIYHQKIVPELFEKDKLLDTLFSGVYDDYSNEVFVKYVTDSFFELFAVKDCYTESTFNVKKSGYFASRIVSAIILHEMLYSEDYQAQKIFESLSACEDNDSKNAFLAALGEHFKILIQTNIRKIAQNANLIYESSFSGLALLGTTLCATVYYEHENHVEAIYLTAGDSRPYVWSEINGLCQVVEDQEGNDGGMTNYIKANDGADFVIKCDYMSFKKPCVLFNASDGCFDSGKFLSQMAFEKTILDGAVTSEDTEKMSEYLTAFFLEYGRHDDSSTIAMKMFGYESFEDFKAACQNRLQVLQAEYFDTMADVLDFDYISTYKESERTFPAQLASLKEKFSSEQGVVDYCSEYVEAGNYAPYLDKIRAIDEKIAAEEQCKADAVSSITSIVVDNFILFKSYTECDEKSLKKLNSTKVESAGVKYHEAVDAYMARLKQYRLEFDDSVLALSSLLDSIEQIGVPATFEDFDQVTFDCCANYEKSMSELFSFFSSLRTKRLDNVKKMIAQRQEYVIGNHKLAEKNQDDSEKICLMIVNGSLDIAEIDISEEEKAKISDAVETINQANDRIHHLQTDEKARVLDEAVVSYWESQYIDIILAVMNDDKYVIDAELIDQAKAVIQEYQGKVQDLKESSEVQKALFEKYDATYYMYIGGSTDDDSRI